MRPATPLLLLGLLGLALASRSPGETYVWIDEHGVTHLTDDPSRVPAEAPSAVEGRAGLDELWDGPLGDADTRTRAAAPSDRAEARVQRLLAGAVADLERGENGRAAVALEDVLREHPRRAEAHWYLALLDRHRGRYASAAAHLRAFLAAAGDDFDAWRASAERRLAALDDEQRLADDAAGAGESEWRQLDSQHFRVSYDAEFERDSDEYVRTVMRYLEEARESVSERIGAVPVERMGVVFYSRAAYQRTYGQRFSFQTVGFYDGRIHVVSAAHPAGELRALLFHEYVHAIFREQTGGDRPYWLNEGLAELTERASRRQPGLTRTERSLLRTRIDAGEWIPLRRLAPSFAGLDDDDARAAYLEASEAVEWIEAHTERGQRAALLDALGAGQSVDHALQGLLGVDTERLDRTVQRAIRAEFPSQPARAGMDSGR
jgi:tetratricopeptide (TPR) repeat protein